MTRFELALTQSYQESLVGLGHQKQAHVTKAVLKLQRGHESSHLHKLEGLPFHAFGVNQGAFRVICKRDGDTLILLHVGPHDAAYQWAARHRVVRIGKVVRLLRTAIEQGVGSKQEDELALPGPLASVPDKTFHHFDLTPGVAAVLRRIPNENALVDLLLCFKEHLAEAILGLSTDPGDLQHLVRAFNDAQKAQAAPEVQPQTEAPLSEVLKANINSADFWLAPTDDALLEAALNQPLETWKTFLHPSQKRLVKLETKGAYKVTGGPGTGKTIVALHRARYLAERLQPIDARPILLTTFSRVLAKELKRSLELLCIDNPKLLERIEVQTITQVAQSILKQASKPAMFLEDDILNACWSKAMRFEGLGRPESFYRAEREHVLARNGAWTESQYLRTRREGRRSRIDRVARRKVWRVLDAFEKELAHRNGGDGASLAREAALLITSGQLNSPYAAVICDELQDVSAGDLRLMAALTRDTSTGKTRPNSLFVAGDNYQSLYRAPIVLSRCGIEVRGNASVLRRNYRTTEGIRKAAIAVVRNISFDDTEDNGDLNVLDNYVSLRPGPQPDRRSFPSAEEEADWIVAQIQQDASAWPLLILTRTNSWLEGLANRLRTRGVTPKLLGAHESLSSTDKVVLCSLHRSKGLEAPRVIIAGAHLVPRPWNGKGDAGDKLIWERQEKCLLYVGMTRARDWCAVTKTS